MGQMEGSCLSAARVFVGVCLRVCMRVCVCVCMSVFCGSDGGVSSQRCSCVVFVLVCVYESVRVVYESESVRV